MHLFGKISFPQPIIRPRGIKKTTRKGEEMFEGHYRLCRFETCFLGRGFIDDNGVAKFGEVVTHRSVESDLSLFDQFQGSQLKRTRWISSGGMRPEDETMTHRSNQFGLAADPQNTVRPDFPTGGIANYIRSSSLKVYLPIKV